MTEEKLPRREREKERQRKEILESALILFSERGFHDVTMHEIAKESEFAIGTLYKFFQNKEDLYKALVLEQCEEFHAQLTAALDSPGNEIDKLRCYLKTKTEICYNNLSFVRLYLAESRGIGFNVINAYQEVNDKYQQTLMVIADIFSSGIKNGRFKPTAEPFHLAVALDSTINALLLLWLTAPQTDPCPNNLDAIVLDILLKGLIN